MITNRSTTDFVYDAEGNKETEKSWVDMNGNLVMADKENNKGIPEQKRQKI